MLPRVCVNHHTSFLKPFIIGGVISGCRSRMTTVKNPELLRIPSNLEEATSWQLEWAHEIEGHSIELLNKQDIPKIRWVTGVDVSYPNDLGTRQSICCAVTWDLVTGREEECGYSRGEPGFPYEPGYLGFREVDLMVSAIQQLNRTPDVIMVDGHGLVHPRGYGEAVHLGNVLEIPTFGVAKNPFVGYCTWKGLKRVKGNRTDIIGFRDRVTSEYGPLGMEKGEEESSDGIKLGEAVCLGDDRKPVFISTGWGITLEACVRIALSCTGDHRQPEPLFLADFYSRVELDSLPENIDSV